MNQQVGREYAGHAEPGYVDVLRRLQGAKRDLQTSRKVHVCSRAMCNPESEATLISAGSLAGPPLSSNVYLCKYGSVHMCSEHTCDVYQTMRDQTCHISGRTYHTQQLMSSSYDKNDYRTWRAPDTASQARVPTQTAPRDKAARKRMRTKAAAEAAALAKRINPGHSHNRVPSDESVLERARTLVTLLLYSTCRKTRNEAFVLECADEAEKATQNYAAQRALIGQLPYQSDIYRIKAHFCSRPLPFVEFAYDEALCEYYARVVLQVWKITCRYYQREAAPRIDVDAVCLGTLYGMRCGQSYNSIMILPRDTFLLNNLPLINALPFFKGVDKKSISRGDRIISEAYETALRQGVPVHTLLLKPFGQ